MDITGTNIFCEFYWLIDSYIYNVISEPAELLKVKISAEMTLKIKILISTGLSLVSVSSSTRYIYYYHLIPEANNKGYRRGFHDGRAQGSQEERKKVMEEIELCVNQVTPK